MPNTNVFTLDEINQIIEQLNAHPGARLQYIGSRYVPIFGRKGEDSIEWDNTGTYEPLTIVLHQGNSYTSRQFVPVGVEITNEEYWANTGNYNAQIEQYRQEVIKYQDQVNTFDSRITENANKLETIKSVEYVVELEGDTSTPENTSNTINKILLEITAGSAITPLRYLIKGGNINIANTIMVNVPNQYTQIDFDFRSLSGDINGYLLDITGQVQCILIKIGTINNANENGSGIYLHASDDTSTWIQYSSIEILLDYCKNIGINLNPNDSFINEIYITCRRLMSSKIGIQATRIGSLTVANTGCEYSPIRLNACSFANLINVRAIENSDYTPLIETVGECRQLNIIGGDIISLGSVNNSEVNRYSLSNETFGIVLAEVDDAVFQGVSRNGLIAYIWQGFVYNPYAGASLNIPQENPSYDITEHPSGVAPYKYITAYNASEVILDGRVYFHANGCNDVFISGRNGQSIAIKIKYPNGSIYTIDTITSENIVEYKYLVSRSSNINSGFMLIKLPDNQLIVKDTPDE